MDILPLASYDGTHWECCPSRTLLLAGIHELFLISCAWSQPAQPAKPSPVTMLTQLFLLKADAGAWTAPPADLWGRWTPVQGLCWKETPCVPNLTAYRTDVFPLVVAEALRSVQRQIFWKIFLIVIRRLFSNGLKKKKKKEKSTGARKAQQVSTSKTPHVLQKGLSSTVELHLLKASSADKVKKSRINQPK